MKKHFTEKQINISTLLGGPLAGGLMLYSSFRKLGKKDEARIALSVMVFLAIIFWVLVFNIENELLGRSLGILATAFFVGLTSLTYKRYLKEKINNKLDEGAGKSSSWLILPYSLGGLIISLVIFFLIGMNQDPFEGSKTLYGTTDNEIFYDKGNIGLESLNKIAGVLKRYGYFNDESQMSARAVIYDNSLKVTIILSYDVYNNAQVNDALKQMKNSMQATLAMPSKVVVEYYDLGGNAYFRTF
ncbi:MAG: hypothetical protein C0598_12205 [Marinilabiliales bacterium]|nr:MAG: hypothetical protein C0598_12205 [Marinilabiliales bacterium]